MIWIKEHPGLQGSLVSGGGARQAHGRLEERAAAQLRCEMTVGEACAGGTGWAACGWRESEEELLCELAELEMALRPEASNPSTPHCG